jgi:AraC-like DNA-binding protein
MKMDDANIFYFNAAAGKVYAARRISDGMQEIEVILSGKGHFKSPDGEWLPVFAGSMLWFQHGDNVEARADAEDPYLTCVFRLTEMPHFEHHSRLTVWRNPQECRPFCERALAAFTGGFADDIYWRCLVARLYWEELESAIVWRHSEFHPVLIKALDFINKNFCQNVTVEKIARASGISLPHLYMLFRKQLKTSPVQMLMTLRLEHAQNLLRMTDKPVKEICADCAFPDPGNFGAVFKRRFGMTPTEFRTWKA